MRREYERQFEEAFRKLSDELFRHASIRLPSRERALELTQDAYVRAWEYLSRGEEIREFRPFLYRILKNLIIDEYRKQKTESLEGMIHEDEGESLDMLVPPDETNTLEAAVARMDGTQALEALAQLPDSYREVLTFRYVDGLSPREIAVIQEENENAISVRIHRGLKKLRALLYPNDL
jgi:RNA polymerase sigma-70 factor (ECF subfamily)